MLVEGGGTSLISPLVGRWLLKTQVWSLERKVGNLMYLAF